MQHSGAESRESATRSISSGISHEILAKHFHLPLTVVSKKFGLCPTALKKLCRKFGIVRWPFRKLKMLDKKIAALRAEAIYASGRGDSGKQGGDLQKLEQTRARIFVSDSRWSSAGSLEEEEDEGEEEEEEEEEEGEEDESVVKSQAKVKVERGSIAFLTDSDDGAAARALGHTSKTKDRPGGDSKEAPLSRQVSWLQRSKSDGDLLSSCGGSSVATESECVSVTVLAEHAPSLLALCTSAGIPVLRAAPSPLPPSLLPAAPGSLPAPLSAPAGGRRRASFPQATAPPPSALG